ncbi:HMG domain-containing protein 3-like [Siphateles boraxobius]|uniref:HMG domain-containing protein 3-like n=1 Tax=Siphateles boraxobius TaxID=180520 RepID=UPI004062AC6D
MDSVGETDKHECLGGPEEGETIQSYPPKGDGLTHMVKYILTDKKLPAVLPDHLRLPSKEFQYPRQLVPEEMICQRCPGNVPLSEPALITDKARILTSFGIIEDVSTYCKRCPVCDLCYRNQEWKDGVHNFSDRILLDLPLCVSLRNLLQVMSFDINVTSMAYESHESGTRTVHTAVSRAVDYLQLNTGVKFPSKDAVLHAYLHFEALTDHNYNYSCVTCGDHPAVVIMDLHKKGAFHLSISDLEDPPVSYNGEVDIDMFWESLAMEMIGRGFVKSSKHNPFLVPPTYHFWAPWIGPRTRSDIVLNTEFAKVQAPKSVAEVQEITVTEDRLTDELSKQKVGVIRKQCRECGLDATGSRNDLLLRISREMKSRHTYDKVFQKIWAASGGWAVVLCPCGIVYSIKHNIRSESPRDFADILLSWRHMPNVAIYDFARVLATHTNLREPEKVPFSPFEGRLLAPSEETIALAKQGKVKVSLHWLESSKIVPDRGGHPVTGSAEHYCLYDEFHEANTKDNRDLLRKISLVPQLAGKVNSQVAEELFAKLKKNNYFLNMSQPSTHVFLMRNIVHHMNAQKNNTRFEGVWS